MDARSFLWACCLYGCLSGSLPAQESKPWWNPFATTTTASSSSAEGVRNSSFFDGSSKKSPSSASSSSKATATSMFKMPPLPWSSAAKSKASSTSSSRKSTAPSTLSRVGSSTKKAWNSTVDFLNPFDSPAPKIQQGYQPQNVKKSSGSGPFGWMWREEQVETPSTVNDFLRQERPRF